QDVAIPREALELVVRDVGGAPGESLAEVELARDDGAARAGDDVRADLREAAFREVGVALEELTRDGELEHAVAEKLQPLVGRRSVARPRCVRVDLLGPFLG